MIDTTSSENDCLSDEQWAHHERARMRSIAESDAAKFRSEISHGRLAQGVSVVGRQGESNRESSNEGFSTGVAIAIGAALIDAMI